MSNISRRLRLLIDLLIRERGRRKIAVVVHMCALCCSVSCLDLRASGALKAGGVAVGSKANHVQLVSGTPQADAVLSALNDPSVTVALLVEDVGVTQFAAESWIDWRESQPFTSIDDVVHAAGVTPSDVTLLAGPGEMAIYPSKLNCLVLGMGSTSRLTLLRSHCDWSTRPRHVFWTKTSDSILAQSIAFLTLGLSHR